MRYTYSERQEIIRDAAELIAEFLKANEEIYRPAGRGFSWHSAIGQSPESILAQLRKLSREGV